MAMAFQGFKGTNAQKAIWQPSESTFPFKCQQCQREFKQGGKRWLGSSVTRQSHHAVTCICDDCKNGKNPLKKQMPILANRRTSLD